nr:hypothetical protein [Tanacetum cinerariifolium]
MAISQSSALCMDQWRELFSNAGVDIDDNNLATVEHKATGHRFNINEDVTRGDKESKDSLDGGMDVKRKYASLPQIDLSTFFDGIDDDGEVYNKKMEETPNKKRQGKQLKLIMKAEIEKQSTGLKPIKHSGYVEKRLHIPATSGAHVD